MKIKIAIMVLSAVGLLSSCVTTVKTARSAETSASIQNATVADLDVTDHRISYTMTPSKEIQRAGLFNVKQAAIQEALTANGNADVMVEPEFVISMKNKFILGKEVSSITVTGRPAYYKNFRTLNDSVWATAGFYGKPKTVNYINGRNQTGEYDSRQSNKSSNYNRNNSLARIGLFGLLGLLGKKSSKDYEYDGSGRSGFGGRIEAVGGGQRLKADDGGGKTDSKAFTGGYLTLGYHVLPNVFVGAGTGCTYDFDLEYVIIPVFGDIRYTFSPTGKNGFFVDVKVGGGTEVNKSRIKGGVFVNPSIGYNFGNFDIALTYTLQKVKMEDKYNYYTDSNYYSYNMDFKADVNRWGLSLAFTF